MEIIDIKIKVPPGLNAKQYREAWTDGYTACVSRLLADAADQGIVFPIQHLDTAQRAVARPSEKQQRSRQISLHSWQSKRLDLAR